MGKISISVFCHLFLNNILNNIVCVHILIRKTKMQMAPAYMRKNVFGKHAVCGKCCLGHETKDCTSNPSDYKCFHCKQTDHTTGSNSCELMKEKYQILSNRQDS